MQADTDDLDRFLRAQTGVFDRALDELRDGAKRGHWMWFVFPQIRGLGRSPMAQAYAIDSLAQARAYLAHPTLGSRLRRCTAAVLDTENRTLHDIFGSPDDLKFRSSMTLFAAASGKENNLFALALDRFCAGQPDARTLDIINRPRTGPA